MKNIFTAIIGDFKEKDRYLKNEERVKSLPKEYSEAYAKIKKYLWNTGMMTIDPLVTLVDLLEEAAANGKHVTDVIGTDVASFADDLVRDEKTYKNLQAKKLNDNISQK